jgi:alpha-1,2-mannosyltransferase
MRSDTIRRQADVLVPTVAADRSSVVRRPSTRTLILAGVAILAFAVRLLPVLLGGGLGSYGRYDDGVYSAAADALTFGRMPYRDFVFLHPPGIIVVLAPFAMLGRLFSDPVGMAAGRLAFMTIGSLNAVLVAALAHRWGRSAAIAAGVMYACFFAAIYDEQTTLLEPLGGTALLVALLFLLKTRRAPNARAELLSGAALGFAVTLKIWYVAPWAVVIVWLLLMRRWWGATRVAIGGAIALLIVVAPFATFAPTRMFDMVVRDQFLRQPAAAASRLGRLPGILGIESFVAGHPAALVIGTVAALMVLIACAVLCWVDRAGRVLVALLAVNLVVLLASPIYFSHYAALTAAPTALVIGVALGKLRAPTRRSRPATLVFGLALLMFLASGIGIAIRGEDRPFPGAQLAAAAPPGCVTSDFPEALIQMNRLSSDLRSGCRVAIDVTGITYSSLRRTEPDGTIVPRGSNRAFQRYLYSYLLSGESFVIARRRDDAMAPDISRALGKRPVLTRSDGLALQRGDGAA